MEYQEIIKEQFGQLDFSELQTILRKDAATGSALLGNFSPETIAEDLSAGKAILDTEVLIGGIRDLFLYEVRSALVLGAEIIAVAVIIGLLRSFSDTMEERTVSNLGMLVSACFIIGLCLNSFTLTFGLCRDTIRILTSTMQILMPVLITLLISSGGIASGSLLNPIILSSVTALNTILDRVILPAVFISTVFFLVNSLTEKDYVHRLAVFIRNAATFSCGICVTIFTGVTALQGVVSESADGILLDTARFSMSNFVPIVGGFASDSVDMALSCFRLIRGSVGIFGVMILLAVLLTPMIKLLAIAVIYKITAVITEPLGSRETGECLNQMGNSVITMTVILFLTSMMFLIFITIIIGIGG